MFFYEEDRQKLKSMLCINESMGNFFYEVLVKLEKLNIKIDSLLPTSSDKLPKKEKKKPGRKKKIAETPIL